MRRPWGDRLTPAQRFSSILLTVLVVGGTGLSVTAAALIQQRVLGQAWVETLHGVEMHFTAILGTDIFLDSLEASAHAEAGHAHHTSSGGHASTYDSDDDEGYGYDSVDHDAFDQLVRLHLGIYDIVDARFFRQDGEIVYSYHPHEAGSDVGLVAPASAVASALRGEVVAYEHAIPAGASPDGRPYANVVAFFVPVKRDGAVVGVAWVERDISGILGGVRQAQVIVSAVALAVAGALFFAVRRVFVDSTAVIRQQKRALEEALRELSETYDATLQALMNALDGRDAETGDHAQRVAGVAVRLGRELGLSESDLIDLERGAVLHDIGKIGVPDDILLKPGSLTDAEWAIMRQHPVIGAMMLADLPFLSTAIPVVRHHHERWDGAGYPDGLRGTAIPHLARIFAVADALDAMTAPRPYRSAVPLAAARSEIARGAGAQFDPNVVAAFERVSDAELALLLGQAQVLAASAAD